MAEATSLRARLRRDTSTAHERLDALVTRLDVATLPGLSAFLRGQHAAMTVLLRDVRPAPGPGIPAGLSRGMDEALANRLQDSATRLAADLATLGLGHSPVPRLTGPPPARDALRYVCLGARAGAVVLARRHAGADDPRLCAARTFFAAPPAGEDWRSLCADLAARPAQGAQADRIVADAQRLFALFETCFEGALHHGAMAAPADPAAPGARA